MNNFLEFITNDIEAKKTLISTMPVKTKINISNYNNKVESMIERYNIYAAGVKKYIQIKSKSFNIKSTKKDTSKLKKEIEKLEQVRFLSNPLNSYFEKMKFDTLLYKISNYNDFSFDELTNIINEFLDKFELVGITLKNYEFDYTYYVNKFMNAFLDARLSKNNNYDTVSTVFEKIYWENPEVINHVELNLRKLIKKYQNKFIDYIEKQKKQAMLECSVINYDDCLKKIEESVSKYRLETKEDIYDIVELSKNGDIDIEQCFTDNKIRIATYDELLLDGSYMNNKEMLGEFYCNLEKLKCNIEEYNSYVEFIPLINSFKKQYSDAVNTTNSLVDIAKSLKDISLKIAIAEDKLEKTNKKIITGKSGLFKSYSQIELKQLKNDSIKEAEQLYEIYKEYDSLYFKNKVLSFISNMSTISDLLNLYYSFDYFKKFELKKVFAITRLEDLMGYCDRFDKFAVDPGNIILNGTGLFDKNDIDRVIMNRYRLNNINLNEENLNPDVLEVLLDKIQLLLRINEIEKSTLSVEKIWFMSKVEQILRKESETS